MGIHNFKLFLNTLNFKPSNVEEYDSIFIDIQSFLYRAIQNSFKSQESELKEDICLNVLNELSDLLKNMFSYGCFKDNLKIIISFDGESVPMKIPTQKERRNVQVQGKNLFKMVLLGHNTISNQVRNYIIDTLTNYSSKFFSNSVKIPSKLEFIICGSDTKGEGEHKLFYLGKHFKCRKPLIASVDNDVFIISLSQLSEFDSIQIYKNNNTILNVNQFVSYFLTYDKEYCILASLLFGNDFIPSVISLTENNCPTIHQALNQCEKHYMPHIFYTILKLLSDTSKIRFKIPPQIEENIILEFWKNCFWILDYYEKYNFPQKYLENYLFDIFDKNHITTALLDLEYSEKTYEKAYLIYKDMKTDDVDFDPKQYIFTDVQLKSYDRFFLKEKNTLETYNHIKLNVF